MARSHRTAPARVSPATRVHLAPPTQPHACVASVGTALAAVQTAATAPRDRTARVLACPHPRAADRVTRDGTATPPVRRLHSAVGHARLGTRASRGRRQRLQRCAVRARGVGPGRTSARLVSWATRVRLDQPTAPPHRVRLDSTRQLVPPPVRRVDLGTTVLTWHRRHQIRTSVLRGTHVPPARMRRCDVAMASSVLLAPATPRRTRALVV